MNRRTGIAVCLIIDMNGSQSDLRFCDKAQAVSVWRQNIRKKQISTKLHIFYYIINLNDGAGMCVLAQTNTQQIHAQYIKWNQSTNNRKLFFFFFETVGGTGLSYNSIYRIIAIDIVWTNNRQHRLRISKKYTHTCSESGPQNPPTSWSLEGSQLGSFPISCQPHKWCSTPRVKRAESPRPKAETPHLHNSLPDSNASSEKIHKTSVTTAIKNWL